jgi:signal transduction histidine kinase
VSAARRPAKAGPSLTTRVVVASGLLALLGATIFVILLLAIDRQRDTAARSRDAQRVLLAATALERRTIDLETGERGFIITHNEAFLQPWTAARRAIPAASRALNRLSRLPGQQRRARRITAAVASYIRDYSLPLVDVARRNDPAAVSVATTAAGKRRVDALRGEFSRLIDSESKLADARKDRADDAARQAIVVASVGLVAWLVLIVVYAVYLTRAVVRPVRRAATMAGQLADGDLSVRMPETGPAEIRALEQSFNTMGTSLEANRTELTASRARVVAAADETRRRIERDLHDGTQQRLLSLALELRAAESTVPPDLPELEAQLSRTSRGLAEVVEDLQEIARGIHPAVLSKGGLGPAIKVLARRSVVPVELQLRTDRRLVEPVEVAAYYVVSEALTNAAKHSHASVVQVEVATTDTELRLSVTDDGVGGADAGRGSGLIGLRDRIESLGGTIEIRGAPGKGTSILAKIPIVGQDEPDD